jgi:hypothetical protein
MLYPFAEFTASIFAAFPYVRVAGCDGGGNTAWFPGSDMVPLAAVRLESNLFTYVNYLRELSGGETLQSTGAPALRQSSGGDAESCPSTSKICAA